MEIELKYRIEDSSIFATLLALQTLGSYTLDANQPVEEQRNTYYDTADKRLQKAHYGMRIRTVGDRSIATLKGPRIGSGELHQRQEWEIAATNPDPATWEPSEARTQALALLQNEPVVPTLTIQTTRHIILVLQNQRHIAEICLDKGVIHASDQSKPLCELEVELLSDGTKDDLDAIVIALQNYVVLIPEPRSKLEQGLALIKDGTP